MTFYRLIFKFFRPPKFDIDAALQKKRIKDKHSFLKQKKLLEAYMAPVTTMQTIVQQQTTSIASRSTTKVRIEEFQDASLPTVQEDYIDYYGSGGASEEDY